MGVNVHTDLDARAADPWSPAQQEARERLSPAERAYLDDLEARGEHNEVDAALNGAGVPRAGRDGRVLSQPERVRILAAWAAQRR